MSTTWKTISPAEATAHPLYGVKNWLVVFALAVLLGLSREFGTMSVEARTSGLTLSQLLAIDHPAVTLAKIELSFNAIMIIVIYWALFTKQSKFRLIATTFLVASWPMVVIAGAINPFEGLWNAMAVSFLSWVPSCAIWVTYLNRSRRVRVTFEHMVRITSAPAPETVMSLQHENSHVPESSRQKAHARGAPETPLANCAGKILPLPALEDEDHWATALVEFESDSRRLGVWAKAYSLSAGNEAVAKATYLQVRADELAHERQVLLERASRDSLEKAEREKQRVRYTDSLTTLQKDLQQNIHQAQRNDCGSLRAVIDLIRILDGTADWETVGLFRTAWVVRFDGSSHVFASDEELKSWASSTVLPTASRLIPSIAPEPYDLISAPQSNRSPT